MGDASRRQIWLGALRAAGWSPYTYGRWEWYPGFGWTWVSGEPWGWVTDHCGLWDFDASFGWYWMNPMLGCGYWEPSRVVWYGGLGWFGWAPSGPGRPKPNPPGGGPPRPPHPGPGPAPGTIPRELVTVPATLVQNRQMITPEIVNHIFTHSGDNDSSTHPLNRPRDPQSTADCPSRARGPHR